MLAGRVGARPEERVAKVAVERRGEHCFPVTSIEYPERVTQDAQKARGFAAVKLFLQAAHQVQLGLDPSDTDLAEVARVCRIVQGMPLGILLAAVWLGVLRPVEIAGEIDKGLDFLQAD